ncbi:MAG: hypothetical protein U0822_14720 [Anaerolineae bacterium]
MTWETLLPRNAARPINHARQPLPGSSVPAAADVTFSFFAPRNLAVNLVGNFTTWLPRPMQADEQGWWRADWHLPDGVYEYRFQVLSLTPWIESRWVQVIDLRTPRLSPDKTANRLCVANGQIRGDEYVWRHDDAPLPLDEGLVSVRLSPDSPYFGGSAPSCASVFEALGDMAAAGVKEIVIPSTGTTPGLGHDLACPFFPAAECAQTGSFKCLVDECHRYGIRVIVEMEGTRGDPSGTLAQIDYEYWYAGPPGRSNHNGGPRFDYEHEDERLGIYPAREFARACMFHWIDTYHIDGVHFVGVTSDADRAFLAQLGDEAGARVTFKPFHFEIG